MTDTAQNRLLFLDGIRGWAAFMVLLSHLLIKFLGATTGVFSDWPAVRFISDGKLAVFIFFMLSGFALTTKFHTRPDLKLLLENLVARYFRLATPILITCFFTYLLMKADLLYNAGVGVGSWLGRFYQFEPSLQSLLSYSLFWVFAEGYPPIRYNSILWTMPTELQGSILIFLIAAICLPDKNGQQRLPRLIPILAWVLTFIVPDLNCFLWGYLFARLYTRKTLEKKWVHVLATPLILVPIILSTLRAYPIDYMLQLEAIPLILSITYSPILRKLLSSRLSTFLGSISFPLYLIHLPVLCSFSAYLFKVLPEFGFTDEIAAYINAAASIAVCILLAWLLTPMERFSIRLSKHIGSYAVRVLTRR